MGGGWSLLVHHNLLFSLPLSWSSLDITEILLNMIKNFNSFKTLIFTVYSLISGTAGRPPDKSANWEIILFFIQNICCGYSKEPSQRDGSFEHPYTCFN